MVEEIPALKGFVARVLLSAPDASAKEIMDAARRRYAVVDALTPREFAARYVTPLKRRMGGPRPGERPGSGAAGPSSPQTQGGPRGSPVPRGTGDVEPSGPGSGSALLDAVIADGRRWRHLQRGDGVERAAVGESGASEGGQEPREPPAAVVPENGARSAPREIGAEDGAFVHRPTAGERRAALRLLFMRLALEMAAAETDPDFVQVVGRIDRYVDEALKV